MTRRGAYGCRGRLDTYDVQLEQNLRYSYKGHFGLAGA